MTVLFCGDIHGRIDHLFAAVDALRPAGVVLLGDLEPLVHMVEVAAALSNRTTLRWIHGNHDTDDSDYLARGVFDARYNLHGRVERIGDLRVAGLGGVFRGEVWYPREGEVSPGPHYASFEAYVKATNLRRPTAQRVKETRAGLLAGGDPERIDGRVRKHLSTIFPDVVERLKRLRADVLVTHEAPGCHFLGFPVIDSLARVMGVKSVFHGHHHVHRDYGEEHRPRIVSVGYRAIVADDGRVVFAGESGRENCDA